MKQTYNVDAVDKKDKVTAGPEWVTKDVIAMWDRIDAKAKETGASYTRAAKKYGFSSSSVYNTIAAIKKGQPPRDTELRIIEALAKEMNVSLNYLVHGDVEVPTAKTGKEINESVLDNIFSLGKGNYLSILLMSLPYLDKAERNSIREDVLARFN